MFKSIRRSAVLAVCCLLLLGAALQMPSGKAQTEEMTFDTIIRNGTIIDGSGLPRYEADIGIRDGFIARVGDLEDYSADKELDAEGLFVTPGFIDTHSHASLSALQEAESSLKQGVTTEILSPDGGGPTDIKERFALEEDGLGINIGTFIGFNSVWREVVGSEDRRATPEEISQMRSLVSKAMEDGAFGVSSGLAYTPAYYATTEEVIQVVSAARDWRTNTQSHIRSEYNDVIEATREQIRIGEESGLIPIITHMKVMGPDNWGKSKETVKLIEEANARGTYTAADVYPYLAAMTSLTYLVPEWAQDGGTEAMLERFQDPELRPVIAEEIAEIMQGMVGPAENVYIPSKKITLEDIANDMGVEPAEAVMRTLETEGNFSTIYHFGSEDDFKRILQNPTTALASDGGATTAERTHPRKYGTQPRLLGKYIREEGYLSWEEGVMKMTGLPAVHMGIVDRGFIAEGMAADVTVFDPETVRDKGTFDDPKQYPEGIEYVMVNGELALDKGELTGAQAGKALKRAPNMPSRPMNPSDPIHVDESGELLPIDQNSGTNLQVDFSIDQEPDAKMAEGHFRISGENNELDFQSTGLGKMQVTDGWASFTGRGILNGNEERTFQVILDENEPMFTDQQSPIITVQIEGMEEIRGFLGSSVGQMQSLVKYFEDEGEIANEETARLLLTHLTAVGHYETIDSIDKARKHMESLEELLRHQVDEGAISEEASDVLTIHANHIMKLW